MFEKDETSYIDKYTLWNCMYNPTVAVALTTMHVLYFMAQDCTGQPNENTGCAYGDV
jgi:hypothetical protein